MLAPIASPQFVEEPLRRKRFAREEVNQMLDLGLFSGQRFELIDGDLIDKMGQSPAHFAAIMHIAEWLRAIFGYLRVRTQGPIEVSVGDRDYSEPEPDIAVTAVASGIRDRHPRGDELILVIEVSDSSLRGDATTKRDLYARADVPEYWILDLRRSRIIVHRNPVQGVYTEIRIAEEGDIVSTAAVPDTTMTVRDLMP